MRNFLSRQMILLLFVFLFSCASWSTPSEKECERVLESASKRRTTIQKFISNIKYLKNSVGSAELPLGILFQVDLTNEEAVGARIAELSAEIEKEAILALPELKSLVTCASKESEKNEIQDLAAELASLNAEKVDFLKLESAKREQLEKSYEARRQQDSGRFELKNHLQKSNDTILKAKQELIASESEAANALGEPEIAALYEVDGALSQLKIDLEKQQVVFIEGLSSRSEALEDFYAKVSRKADVEKIVDKVSLAEFYKEVAEVWRKSAATLFSLFQDVDIDIKVDVPELQVFNAKNDLQKKTYGDYLEKLNQVKIRLQELSDDRLDLINNLRARNFEILNRTGVLRSRLLIKCDELACGRERGVTEQNALDFFLELKLVPFKVAAGGISKFLEVKTKFSAGFDGWVDLAKQLLFFLFLFWIPFLVLKFLRWVTVRLGRIRKNLLNRTMMDYHKRTLVATWISRVSPFVPSVGMLLLIILSRNVIEKTDLSGISNILFYAEIYFFYKVLRNILKIVFEVLFSTESIDRGKIQKHKIEKSTATIARLLLVEFILFHITEDAVRKAFVYNILTSVAFWINVAAVLYISNAWKEEIVEAGTIRFPKFESYFKLLASKKTLIFLLPFVFVLVFLSDLVLWLNSHLIKIDFVKRILSDVLRRQLESVEKEEKAQIAPPAQYMAAFDYYLPASPDIFVESADSPVSNVVAMINEWSSGKKSDDLAILVGNRGLGKSTALEQIRIRISNTMPVKKVSVPARTLTTLQLFEWLTEITGTSITSIVEFKNFDKVLESKQVLLVDDCQNLFLGIIGGFEAYKVFLEIISLKTKNIFWCAAVNSRSWDYIKGVFGEEHFYGKAIVVEPWKDFEVQNLILRRHEQTGFGRSFDKSIKAYGAGDVPGQQAEAQFFRLLWGQSRGNPRSALMYWISAISSPSEKMIHVGIPSFVSSSLVASMSDESLFVLAAVARHENLSHEEIVQVTGISETIIRKCLKEGLDKDLIWSDDLGRVRISSRAQYVIDYFLIGKNFLYE